MVDDINAVLEHAQTIVIGNNDPEFRKIPERRQDGQYIVDLARIAQFGTTNGTYECIC
jgi:GDP-mannose 6-dehydrogenase